MDRNVAMAGGTISHRLYILQQSMGSLIHKVSGAPCSVDKTQLGEMIDLCRVVFFPEYAPMVELASCLRRISTILMAQLVNGFRLRDYVGSLYRSKKGAVEGKQDERAKEQAYWKAAEQISDEFLLCRLAKIKVLLQLDVEALFRHDVAAESKCEVILCYPGVTCMTHQRVAHELYRLGAPNNVTRMLTEMAHSLTGIDIHPHTTIGHHFYIDHGTGVVIGATANIGNHVCIYQGVTLGAKSFPVDPVTGEKIKNLPRHPIIEDGVTIYSNAVVLGRITIGRGSTIAGNSWVTSTVPPGSTVTQAKTKVVKGGDLFSAQHEGSGI